MSDAEPSLYLATPCYGGSAHLVYLRSLLALERSCAARSLPLQLDLGGGEALIGRARAGMMARFLISGASHLLFVDADIGFQADQAFRLLQAGKDVVGGVYARKGPDCQAVGRLELDPLAAPEPPQAGFQAVAHLGAGFLMIRRSAALRMQKGYPRLEARLGDVNTAGVSQAVMVFDSMIDPDTGRYLADHQAFCRRWRDLGGEVWADLTGRLTHIGEVALAPLNLP